jgi:hypothetical protein
MGAEVAVMAGATDDRIKGVFMVNPYNHLYIEPEKGAGKGVSGKKNIPNEIVLEIKKQLDVLNPSLYINQLTPRPVTIVTETSDEVGGGKPPELYQSTYEPKEFLRVKSPEDGVSKWLGTCLRTVAGFVRDVVQGKGLGTSASDTGATVSNVETPGKDLDKWSGADISGGKGKNCSVETLEAAKKTIEGGQIVILNSRIGKCAGKAATVISEIIGNGTSADYIQLFDNGKGYDNKEGDGIFSVGYRAPKSAEKLTVTVGGVGDGGEAIIEKVMEIGPWK